MTDRWLPVDFPHPEHVAVDEQFHLRPITPQDVHIDYPAVMGSRESLWQRYGAANNWPKESMTVAEDEADLARHAREAERNESFNYAILDEAEQVLAGCIYIDPPADEGADADISWWVTDDQVGGTLHTTLDRFVPDWIAAEWPFRNPRLDPRSFS